MDDSEKIRRILRKYRTLAVVGLSAQWHRPSFFASLARALVMLLVLGAITIASAAAVSTRCSRKAPR